MSIVAITDGIIDLIRKNIIAKTNVISNVTTGDTSIAVEDSHHFQPDQEIVLIDYGYNQPGHPHYQKYEYAVVDSITNTHSIVLQTPVIDNWLVSDSTFIQKTIGHSPLYDDRVYYGDREVIPTEEMALTVEPLSQSTEWIYLQGGMSREYRISIMVYGKDISTEEGMKILNKYTESLQELFNRNIHIDVNNYETPLVADVPVGTLVLRIEDTPDNRENFVVSTLLPDDLVYEIQDNYHSEIDRAIMNVSYGGGLIYVTLDYPTVESYSLNDYAVLRKHGTYIYDSRVDNIEYGTVQKGSAFIRAARLNWFGKHVTEYRFPQITDGNDYFPQITPMSSESSSSSSESAGNTTSSSSEGYTSSSSS